MNKKGKKHEKSIKNHQKGTRACVYGKLLLLLCDFFNLEEYAFVSTYR